MIKSVIYFFAFFLLLVSPARSTIFDARTTTLENGLQIVFIPNHRAPVATHMLWIKAGAVDEPQGRSGIAHYLEHLMFKGTKTTDPGEFSRTVKSFGAEHNAFTSRDYTAYFETVAVEHLEDVMALNADRMMNLAPPREEIVSERDVVIEERRQRIDNNPSSQFYEHMNAAHYMTHPYARPIVGWMDELKELDWAHAENFYRKWYVPNNMILIVTGDLEFENVVNLAQKHYGQMQASDLPERITPVWPDLVGTKILTHYSDKIYQPVFYRLFRAPSFSQSPEEALALRVLKEMIGGKPTTYLHEDIVRRKKLASSIALYYSPHSRYQNSMVIQAVPSEGVSLETLSEEIEQSLSRLAQQGIDETKMAYAKDRLIARTIYSRDSLSGPAMITGRALTTGATLQDIESWDEKIQKISPGQVQNVLNKYIVSPSSAGVQGFIGPAPDRDKSADKQKQPDVEPSEKQQIETQSKDLSKDGAESKPNSADSEEARK